MADWVTITDSQVDPDAPLTSELAYAWRDNPVAIAEGAVGAPRIRIGALQRLTAGNVARITNNPAASAGGNLFDVGFLQVGSVRVTFDKRAGTGSMTFTRLRGATTTTIYSGTISAAGTTSDVDVEPGDRIRVVWSGGGGSSGIYNGAISTGGEDYFPVEVAIGTLTGNTYNV